MIRTVWLAVLCLALVSALAAAKAFRTPSDSTVAEQSGNKTTVGVDRAQDTLSKADRLEVNYVRQETPPPTPLQSIEAPAPVVSSPGPPAEIKIISRHWRDPNSVSGFNDSQRTEFKKKSTNAERKRNQAADRSKPSEPVKPCSRPGALGDLLRAVKLSPACAS
jgi:hypothetical protein